MTSNFVFGCMKDASRQELMSIGIPEEGLLPKDVAEKFLISMSATGYGIFHRAASPEDGTVTIQSVFDKYRTSIEAYAARLREIYRARHDSFISADLNLLRSEGLLSFNAEFDKVPDKVRKALDPWSYEKWLVEQTRLRVAEAGRTALLDDSLDFDSSQRMAASAPFIANKFITRLPGLNDLPIREVLDLRSDLSDSLNSFRNEMLQLSAEMPEMTSHEVEQELDYRWHRDIAPALDEIKRKVALARYPRKLAEALVDDKKAMVAGTAGIFTLTIGGLTLGLDALMAAGPAIGYAALRAKVLSVQAEENAAMHKLYFLYGLREGINSRL